MAHPQQLPTDTPTDRPVLAEVDLSVSGMTCASCVARVERRINKIPGATATVNLPWRAPMWSLPNLSATKT